MGAHVTLNGQYQGAAADQFLRYIFELPSGVLQAKGNVLSVVFVPSQDPINKDNRFMSCSGGWDASTSAHSHHHHHPGP